MAQPCAFGADHATWTCVSPRVTAGFGGASGTLQVRTTGDDGLMLPGVVEPGSRLIARTWKLTSVPLGMSSHVWVLEAPCGVTSTQFGLMLERTWYRVIVSPPSSGAFHETWTCRSPRTALGCAGASGRVKGCSGAERSDQSDQPSLSVVAEF